MTECTGRPLLFSSLPQKKIVADFGVKGIPTMLFFKDGELVTRLVGLRSRGEITAQLDALLADN